MDTRTSQRHALGQRLWLNSISNALLRRGMLARYIADLSITGPRSHPPIVGKAFGERDDKDDTIRSLNAAGLSGEGAYKRAATPPTT